MSSSGERLRAFREKKQENQVDFATKLQMSQQNLSHFENGTREVSSKTIRKLKALYPDLNMDWLETGKGSMINLLISSEISSKPDNNPIPIPKMEYIDLVHSKEILSIKLDSANQKIDALSQVVDSKQKEIETLKILIENLK